MIKRIPHTYAIISSVILICALLSWIIPAGEYNRQTIQVNGVDRTVIVNGSFHAVDATPQTWQVFSALLNGFEKQAGIIAFLIIIGGAFQILNSSRSIDVGILSFLNFTKGMERHRLIKKIGVNNVVIACIMTIFSLFGAVFGMSEETLAFIIIIIPLAISMGYDSITGLCMVYVAAHVGFSGAILNPFTIGIAQGLSDLPLFSGFEYRVFCWLILTTLLIIIVLWYAAKVKKHPEKSPMYAADAYWRNRTSDNAQQIEYKTTRSAYIIYILLLSALFVFSINYPESTFSLGKLSTAWPAIPILSGLFLIFGWLGLRKSNHFFILTILGFTILFLIVGVLGHGWYLPEISAIFLAMGVMAGYANDTKTNDIIKQFTDGAKDMLSTAIVVGLAGGIIQILQDGHIIDPMLHSLSSLMGETSRILSISVMYLIQTLINLIIPSGSAKAALTMPIMAPFSDVIHVSRQATVMAYQFGDGFTNMITPTSAVLMGALGIARIPYDVWIKWFWKILLFFIILGFVLLIPTVLMQLNGF